jgi:hypothetical protein
MKVVLLPRQASFSCSGRSSDSSALSAAFPFIPEQWPNAAERVPFPDGKGGITAAGPSPIFTAFPFGPLSGNLNKLIRIFKAGRFIMSRRI